MLTNYTTQASEYFNAMADEDYHLAQKIAYDVLCDIERFIEPDSIDDRLNHSELWNSHHRWSQRWDKAMADGNMSLIIG